MALKTINYRDTGRLNDRGEQELAPEPMRDTRGLSIFRGGRMENGTWDRFNALGDSAENGAGYFRAIDTLTYIRKKVVSQKFYEVEFGEMVPVSVSEAAFYQNVTTNLVMNAFGDFTQGDIDEGKFNARLATADVGVTPVTQIIKNWAVGTGYNVIEIQQALLAGNWDIVESRQKSRKTMWDLGLQRIAFLGHPSDVRILGLLNQSTVNINTSIITEAISDMDATAFSAFVRALLAAYLANCNNTAMPDSFVIPLSDYVGLADPVSPTFPVISKLEYLKKAFKEIVKGGIEVMPLAYCEAAYNSGVVNLDGIDRYCLYRNQEDTMLMQIPVNLTMTNAGTYNNFQFQDAAYAQYGGVQMFRVLESLYLDIDA